MFKQFNPYYNLIATGNVVETLTGMITKRIEDPYSPLEMYEIVYIFTIIISYILTLPGDTRVRKVIDSMYYKIVYNEDSEMEFQKLLNLEDERQTERDRMRQERLSRSRGSRSMFSPIYNISKNKLAASLTGTLKGQLRFMRKLITRRQDPSYELTTIDMIMISVVFCMFLYILSMFILTNLKEVGGYDIKTTDEYLYDSKQFVLKFLQNLLQVFQSQPNEKQKEIEKNMANPKLEKLKSEFMRDSELIGNSMKKIKSSSKKSVWL